MFSASLVMGMQIGSDNATTEFTTQQLLQNGDRIASFAWLKQGLALQGLQTTVTFDSMFPISGTVALNAGTLLLNTDLTFNNVSSFYTIGNIVGNSHVVDFAPSMTALQSIASPVEGNSFVITATDTLVSAVYFTEWSYDSQFLVAGTGAGGAVQLYLFSYNGQQLTYLDSIAVGDATDDSASWHPSKYALTVVCNAAPQVRVFLINPEVPNLQNEIFTYTLANGIARAVSYNPNGEFVAVGTSDTTEDIIVFPVNSDYTLNTAGAAKVAFSDTAVSVNSGALGWNSTGQYLTVGCSNSGGTFPELRVYHLVSTGTVINSLTLNATALVGAVSTTSFIPTSTYILFAGLNTHPALQAYNLNSSAGTLTLMANLAQPVAVSNISLDPSSNDLVMGLVANPTGPEVFIYNYNLTGTGVFTTVYSANSTGGQDNDAVGWSPNGNYVAYGDNGSLMTILNRYTDAYLTNCFTFSNVYLNLNNDLALNNTCITFAGNCTINGNGNTMTIASTSTLSVGTHSQLRLSNMTLSGITNQNFGPIDNTGSCIFENTNFYLSGNYFWDEGYFVVEDMFKIQGPGQTFIYSTNLVSTVSSFSTLMLDYQTTFSYAPISASNSLINFMDNTGIFKLFNASLYASSAGLAFTQGIFMVDGSSSILNTASSQAQGVSFGDGASAANNTTINILPAAVLNLLSGYLVYQNV
jgi:hypothetical protein